MHSRIKSNILTTVDKEALRLMETGQEIIGSRPKDQDERDRYWRRYNDLAEGLFFSGRINLKRFRERGFTVALREGMTPDNLSDALDIGKMKGFGTTEVEFACMARELEKVVQFTPISQAPSLV